MKKQLIFALVFSFIILGFGFADFAQATNDPIPSVSITPSDLGVDTVGTLPTSRFYFLKQWGRGIERLFTFNPIAKAELELTITNQIAAEMLEVEKANPDDTSVIKKALENYTNSQERLNVRIGKLPATTNPNVEKLLKNVDEKTAKQASLIEQLTEQHSGQLKFEVVDDSLKNAQDNILKTFTIAVTPVNDEPAMKQKAEDQIKSSLVAIEEANSALMQVSTTRGIKWDSALGIASYLKVTVPKQTQGATFGEKMKTDSSSNDELSIFDRWGNMIAKAKSNLDSAKKAFAEGKYGEAYGQARSAEAMVPVLATGSNFPDKKVDTSVETNNYESKNEDSGKEDDNKNDSDKSLKSILKINEDESSRSTERGSNKEEDKTSIELKSSTTIEGSAGSTSTTIKN